MMKLIIIAFCACFLLTSSEAADEVLTPTNATVQDIIHIDETLDTVKKSLDNVDDILSRYVKILPKVTNASLDKDIDVNFSQLVTGLLKNTAITDIDIPKLIQLINDGILQFLEEFGISKSVSSKPLYQQLLQHILQEVDKEIMFLLDTLKKIQNYPKIKESAQAFIQNAKSVVKREIGDGVSKLDLNILTNQFSEFLKQYGFTIEKNDGENHSGEISVQEFIKKLPEIFKDLPSNVTDTVINVLGNVSQLVEDIDIPIK